MKHELSLTLVLLEHAADGLRFRLVLRNCAEAKILVPYPEIQNLRFCNKATMQESEWFTYMFVSATWAGFTLGHAEEKAIEYRVRTSDVPAPKSDDHSDYFRWCVELPLGEYLVWFEFEVGEDYFCPDSHYKYTDLLREAELAEAVVWTGHAKSNRLTLYRA